MFDDLRLKYVAICLLLCSSETIRHWSSIPDRPLHDFRALKSVAWWASSGIETSIDGLRGSKIGKGSVGCAGKEPDATFHKFHNLTRPCVSWSGNLPDWISQDKRIVSQSFDLISLLPSQRLMSRWKYQFSCDYWSQASWAQPVFRRIKLSEEWWGLL